MRFVTAYTHTHTRARAHSPPLLARTCAAPTLLQRAARHQRLHAEGHGAHTPHRHAAPDAAAGGLRRHHLRQQLLPLLR